MRIEPFTKNCTVHAVNLNNRRLISSDVFDNMHVERKLSRGYSWERALFSFVVTNCCQLNVITIEITK